jgi:WD40-like Beta Propeller Repeat
MNKLRVVLCFTVIGLFLAGCGKTTTQEPTPSKPISTITPITRKASPTPLTTVTAPPLPTATDTTPITQLPPTITPAPTRTVAPTRTATSSASPTSTRVPTHGDSFHPAISGDGRYVVFASQAGDLVLGAKNQCSQMRAERYNCTDIYLYDRQERSMRLVSKSPDGQPTNGDSWTPAISADGRWIVFVSCATNLVPVYTTYENGLYLYDVLSDNLKILAIQGSRPSISADGRFIVYEKILLHGEIYLIDRETGKQQTIIKTYYGQPVNGDNWFPQISGDGRWIAFWSWASNLVPDDTERCREVYEGVEDNTSCGDVFLYNRETGQMERIPAGEGYGLGMIVFPLSLSDDGSRVLIIGKVFDRDTGRTLCYDCWRGKLSANGKLVAYESSDFYVRHLATGNIELANVASDGTPGNGEWVGFSELIEGPDFEPSFGFSADGRCVVFPSTATNLTTDEKQRCNGSPFPPHACYDIYLHNLETGLTELISKPGVGKP